MITAKEARGIVNKNNAAKAYLTTLNNEIKIAAARGFDHFTMNWKTGIAQETIDEVRKTLKNNGYEVNLLAPSRFCSNGAIMVKW